MSFPKRLLGFIFLVCVFLVLLLNPLAFLLHPNRAQLTTTAAATANPQAQTGIRILFIGNSYTFVNDLPGLIKELAVSAHEKRLPETEQATEGGATLKLHWQNQKALRAIRSKHWDYVVLQEHSTLGPTQAVNGVLPINDPTDFYTYARLFDAEIKKAGAQTIFFMTWARQNAPHNQAIIAKAYTTIAQELHDTVAPVGLAWQTVIQTRPELILHQNDQSHPNLTGSYLAACVFYATIYHKSPEGLTSKISIAAADVNAYAHTSDDKPYSPGLVDVVDREPDALFLQRVAWQVVAQFNHLPTAPPAKAALTGR